MPVPGSGVGSTFGYSPEVSYGGYVAPARWLPHLSETLDEQKTIVQGQGLYGAASLPLSQQRVVNRRSVSGAVVQPMAQNKMGTLIAAALGATPAATQIGSTSAYRQAYTPGTVLNSFTMQAGVPSTDGTSNPRTFLGCVITQAVFEFASDGLAQVTWTIDGQKEDTSKTLTSPSVTQSAPLPFSGLTVTGGTFGSEATLDGIRKVTVTVSRPLDVERYYAGGAGFKAAPVVNAIPTVQIGFETDYVSNTLKTLFDAQTGFSTIVGCNGALLDSGTSTYAGITFALPSGFLSGNGPTVGGPGVVQPTWTIDGTNDLSHTPFTATYISTDTTA